MSKKYDLIIVGGGPAGMGAALEAKKQGINNILILERDKYLGGILPQCIHNGFGLEYFDKELTGPEYSLVFKEKVLKSNIEIKTETMVTNITRNKEITALNKKDGVLKLNASAIILAMGCRERTRENIKIPGDRISGVFTAGTAQRYINIEGYMPGKNVVILGSGDIGLIMARRMKLEGAKVNGVFEIMPYSSGLVRNKVQCLDDFDIPLEIQHTITRIEGKDRVENVIVSKVDKNLKPISGTETKIKCDTVLLSVGLIPENELSKNIGLNLHPVTGGPVVNEFRETEIDGIFAAGNVLHVHDLVDWVTEESEIAGKGVKNYLSGKKNRRKNTLNLKPGNNINYIVPHKIEYKDSSRKNTKLFMRVNKPMEDVKINLIYNEKNLLSYKKDIVTPGEMVNINLPEAIIDKNMNNIKISVEKKGSDAIV
ncbi:MAG: NAD(P)/FAD-dependent oxidoreductase [Halanaerobiaceae bacterium]